MVYLIGYAVLSVLMFLVAAYAFFERDSELTIGSLCLAWLLGFIFPVTLFALAQLWFEDSTIMQRIGSFVVVKKHRD